MKFQFNILEQTRAVEMQREGTGYRALIDGREHAVDAVRVGPDTWSIIVRDGDNGTLRSVQATVVPQNGNGVVDVYIDGHRVTVGQLTGLGRRARGAGGTSGSGPQRLTAPMPGKVVRVLVAPGDDVQPRQALIVVEAMKMENELRAARAGRVREIFVSEGQSVEAGTALVVVE